MKTTATNGKYTILFNKGEYGFTLFMGYTAGGEDVCTNRKVYKTEKAALKASEKYLN